MTEEQFISLLNLADWPDLVFLNDLDFVDIIRALGSEREHRAVEGPVGRGPEGPFFTITAVGRTVELGTDPNLRRGNVLIRGTVVSILDPGRDP
jgi:hypothetical protein